VVSGRVATAGAASLLTLTHFSFVALFFSLSESSSEVTLSSVSASTPMVFSLSELLADDKDEEGSAMAIGDAGAEVASRTAFLTLALSSLRSSFSLASFSSFSFSSFSSSYVNIGQSSCKKE